MFLHLSKKTHPWSPFEPPLIAFFARHHTSLSLSSLWTLSSHLKTSKIVCLPCIWPVKYKFELGFRHKLTTDCRLRSCHFHSPFCYVIIRWWREPGRVWPEVVCSFRTLNKNRRQNPVWEFTKTIIPFALVGYEVIITNSRYALVGYFITSYPTRAHGIIVI